MVKERKKLTNVCFVIKIRRFVALCFTVSLFQKRLDSVMDASEEHSYSVE